MGNAIVAIQECFGGSDPKNNNGSHMVLHMHGRSMRQKESDRPSGQKAKKGTPSNPNLLKGRNKTQGAAYKSKINFNKVGM
ncbi:hypothetical protein TeGR_g14431 [Tetraparma gracilis]|uniref:Uncharacterized protein n=1 Tax=Tetraparma gracilis TaxID=2962635 RepID=A0ABQ6M4J2_9STRA|nr:hypothetical protein TeGR_g14431 [Tetraparma gracilis]